jgi:hypothetical protein
MAVTSSADLARSDAGKTASRKESNVIDEAIRRMARLGFMVGEWDLDYTAHYGGKADRDLCGTGAIKPLYDGVYLWFEYEVRNKRTHEIGGGARGIFAWDSKSEAYRYYWFESSGAFLNATASLRDAETLYLQWHGVDCTQIFQRVSDDALLLEMTCPEQNLKLRVDMSRRGKSASEASRPE